MRWYHPRHFVRLAVVLLLVLDVVPEAQAAFPVCRYNFGPARSAMWDMSSVSKPTLRHSHGAKIVHDCVATKPDKQSVAQLVQFAPDNAVAVPPAPLHPASMLAARGPSPRGSPAHRNDYLAQRSSVLLLI